MSESFAFRGQIGSYTARQERREPGVRYWYAYLRSGQKVRKKYLGKTADLTPAQLEQVASRWSQAGRGQDKQTRQEAGRGQAAAPTMVRPS